ncbi:MAG: SUMF1/EgtB/PvdO family nonheme iron enzyme [Candidatus Eisenbacteria bacterium]|nr:SUMF1/EgtB/PvdO family nonheme iron enzyme [Candidatus Eisenbacteria bacterium]
MRTNSLPQLFVGLLLVVLVAACGKDKPLLHATNDPPVISALTADPDPVRTNSFSTLRVTASDPEGDSLRYSWSAAANQGSFDTPDSTEAQTRWRAPTVPGTVRLTATVSDGTLSASAILDLVVTAPTATLSGVVRHADTQAPLDGVVVTGGASEDTTAADGRYRLEDLPVGIVTVTASKTGFDTYQFGHNLTADQSATFDFGLLPTVERGRLRGRVTNTLGEAIADAEVSIDTIGTTTDAEGRYAFEPARFGTYAFQASHEGYAPASQSVVIGAAEVTLDATLDALPLPAPTGVTATKTGGLELSVSWQPPSTTAPVRGYFVYRSLNGGEYTRVQETPFGGTVRSHSFTAQEDARYRFVVTALNLENEEGNESPPSNLVVVTLLTPTVVISSGNVVMGNTPAGWGNDGVAPHPGSPVFVGTYRIETREVSNRQYAMFLNEKYSANLLTVVEDEVRSASTVLLNLNASRIDFDDNLGLFTVVSGSENHPVVGVTWYGADAYARSIGRRLPSEAEWEKTARGTSPANGSDGSGNGYGSRYPWGLAAPTAVLANFGDLLGGTRAVDSFAAGATTEWSTPVHHLAGNVWEWCEDWFGTYQSPHGPPSNGTNKVLRGGSFRDSAEYLRVGARFSSPPTAASTSGGFRCASNP